MVELSLHHNPEKKVAPIVTQEKGIWKKIFHPDTEKALGMKESIKELGKISVVDLPECITPVVEMKIERSGFHLVNVPGLDDFGTLEDLKNFGIDTFQENVKKRYPGLNLLDRYYLKKVSEEKIEFPDTSSKWMVVEKIEKNFTYNINRSGLGRNIYSRIEESKKSQPSVRKSIKDNEATVLSRMDLDKSVAGLDLVSYWELFLLQHRNDIVSATGNEWTRTNFREDGEEYFIFSGKTQYSRAGKIDFDNSEYELTATKGSVFRLAATLL